MPMPTKCPSRCENAYRIERDSVARWLGSELCGHVIAVFLLVLATTLRKRLICHLLSMGKVRGNAWSS
jgi:hypothetical protein